MQKNSNKSLWRTYIFIVCFSLLAAATFLNLKWHDIKSDAISQQSYTNKLIANSILNYLNKYEVFLNVVGERLLSQLSESRQFEAKSLIENIMTNHSELAGIGLANNKGELILTSESLNSKKLINLRNKIYTKDTFFDTVKSVRLVLGRTYFMPSLQRWVIPLRISIRNELGAVTGVMTVGINFDDLHKEWLGDSLPYNLKLLVLRKDLYRQFASFFRPNDYQEWIELPLNESRFQSVLKLVHEQTVVVK